jgi:hypothetical protein
MSGRVTVRIDRLVVGGGLRGDRVAAAVEAAIHHELQLSHPRATASGTDMSAAFGASIKEGVAQAMPGGKRP